MKWRLFVRATRPHQLRSAIVTAAAAVLLAMLLLHFPHESSTNGNFDFAPLPLTTRACFAINAPAGAIEFAVDQLSGLIGISPPFGANLYLSYVAGSWFFAWIAVSRWQKPRTILSILVALISVSLACWLVFTALEPLRILFLAFERDSIGALRNSFVLGVLFDATFKLLWAAFLLFALGVRITRLSSRGDWAWPGSRRP